MLSENDKFHYYVVKILHSHPPNYDFTIPVIKLREKKSLTSLIQIGPEEDF